MSTPPGSDGPRPDGPPPGWPPPPVTGAVPPPGAPQPGYGTPAPPPGWGGPEPRPRRRRPLVTALLLAGLVLAVGTAVLVDRLSTTVLDGAAVERAVAGQFEERERVALDLRCDERMVVRPDEDYRCEGTTADGEEVEIRIRVTDAEGAYTWEED